MDVRKVRVTWLACSVVRSAFDSTIFADPQTRKDSWATPAGLALLGHEWRHPWTQAAEQPVEPDRSIWGEWLGVNAVTGKLEAAFVTRMLKQAVPLRAAVTASATADAGAHVDSVFAEAFLQPWASVGAVTVTFLFDQPTHLPQAAELIEAFGNRATLSAQYGGSACVGGPTALANTLAERTVDALNQVPGEARNGPGQGAIATVIDATLEDPYKDYSVVPTFTQSMFRLLGVVAPGTPFHWLRAAGVAGANCSTGEVRVPLVSGIAQWSQGALVARPADPVRQTGGVHRNAVVRWSQISALHGLLAGNWSQQPNWFEVLKSDHQKLLGRLYGPMDGLRDWTAQAYIDLQGISHLLVNPTRQSSWMCP